MTANTEMGAEPRRLSDLTVEQKRCGMAAWLGWLFDGLDSYLYVLVAAPFVAELLHTKDKQSIGNHAAFIQAAFLIGWALGGAAFGWVGDRFGRSRTMAITILTYALFTGFSAFAWDWKSLLVFRFISALGIGGEWLLAHRWWPKPGQKNGEPGPVLACNPRTNLVLLRPHSRCFLWRIPAPDGCFL